MKKQFILGIILGGLLFGTIGVFVASQYYAKDISFTRQNGNWEVDNLEDAINDLYSMDRKTVKVGEMKTQGISYTFENDGYVTGNNDRTYNLELYEF